MSAWAQSLGVVRLDADASQTQTYQPSLSVAAGLSSALTVQDVATLPRDRFVAFDPKATHPISIDSPLWLRLQVDAGQARSSRWQIEMPSVIVDRYEVYQRDASGIWQMAQAGDRVPHVNWPLPSLRPRFALHANWPGVQDIYIRVVHQLPSTIQPVMVDAETATQRDAETMLLTGILVGLMLALLLICLQMVLSYRDWTYLWYAAYLLFIMLSSIAYVGLGQKLVWPSASKFASDAVVYFVLAAFCFNLLFVSAMFGRWLGRKYRQVTYFLVAACVVYMAVNFYAERYAPTIVYFLAITVTTSAFILLTAVQAWRKGVPYSGYWLLVYVPYLISVILVLAEVVGSLTLPWLPVNTPLLTAMVEAVAMMFCLNAYSRESHAQAVREQAAAQRDPLTGFLNESRFMEMAGKSWQRASRSGRDISLAYVLVESKDIGLSTVQFEALMMRSVRVVRTAVRESDLVGRIGRNTLGVAMPDVVPGDDLNARLSRLIALGLMLDPQDSTAQALKFTISVGSWRDNPESFLSIDKQLRALLQSSVEDRPRAIRFLNTYKQ